MVSHVPFKATPLSRKMLSDAFQCNGALVRMPLYFFLFVSCVSLLFVAEVSVRARTDFPNSGGGGAFFLAPGGLGLGLDVNRI